MIDALADEPRLVLDATLRPLVGSTFQPTGFPDLGAAVFDRPGSAQALLVESVQSMANHLEGTAWDTATRRPHPVMSTLPYVEVRSGDGDDVFLSSSRIEPHRLAAAYIRDAVTEDGESGADWLGVQLGLRAGRPTDWATVYRAVFALDPMCLVHGVFFSDKRWHGNPKVRRVSHAVIEAHDIAPAVSGGVKRDDVAFKVDASQERGAKEGYGFVPFGRTEYCADRIVLSAAIDLAQIRGYGLGEPETRLLTALALWELVTLLGAPLRLRTACDLELVDIGVRRPEGATLAGGDELASAISEHTVSFEHEGPRVVRWSPKSAK